jgi:hypothetical protein
MRSRLILAISVFTLIVTSAHAQSYSFNVSNGDWSVASNWTPAGGPPGSGDTATIAFPVGATVTITTPQVCSTLIIGDVGSASTLNINPSGSLTITTSASIQSYCGLTVSSSTSITNTGATINVNAGGSLTNNGTITGGTIVVAPYNGGSGGNFDVSQGSLSGVTTNNSGQAIWLSGNFDLSNGSVFNNLSSGTFNIAISTSGSVTNNAGAPGSFVNSGILTAGSANATFNSGVTFSNNGSVQISSGTILSVNTFTNFDPATDTLTGGAYVIGGVLQLSGVPPPHQIVNNAANITLTGVGGPSGSINDSSSTSMFSGFANNTAAGSLTLLGAGINANGAITNAGSISLTTQYADTSSFLNANGGNFTQTTGASTTINGTAQLGASGIVDLQGGTFQVSRYSITTTISASVNNSGCTIDVGVGQTLNITGNFTQTTGASTTLSIGSQLGVSGIVDLQGGTFHASNLYGGGTSTISTSVNNSGCTIDVDSGETLNIGGNYTQTAGGSFISEDIGGLIAINGSANLNGSVTGSVVNGYKPYPGTYQVMTYTSVVGQFSSVVAQFPSIGFFQTVNSGSLTLTVIGRPVISSVTASLLTGGTTASFLTVETGTPVTFTAVASDPQSLPLTYTWDFGDGSPQVSGNPVNYSYAIEGHFSAQVTVSNGYGLAISPFPGPYYYYPYYVTIETFSPNSGGIANIAQGKPEVIDPLTLLGISVMNSNGGVIGLNIDTDNLRDARGVFNVATEYHGIGTRTAPVSGNTPVNKFVTPGVYVANATANDPVSDVLTGKGRRTVAISGAEVGEPPDITAPPKNHGISKTKLKGKFSFTSADTLEPLAGGGQDSVSFTGAIELPEGFDLSVSHEFDVGIGNIIDSVTVSSSGKATLPGAAQVVSKLTVRYPKAKGGKRTAASQTATVTVTISGSNFSGNGFDTEGVTNNVTAAEKTQKSINRSIQIALVVGGTAYEFEAPVSFKLDKTGTSGSIGTRTGP